jgi:hypothetical protein
MSGALDELSGEEQAQFEHMRNEEPVAPDRPSPPQPPTPQESEPPPQPPPAEEAPRPEPVVPATEAQRAQVELRALQEERRLRKDAEKRLHEEQRRFAADAARNDERVRLLSEAAQAYMAQNAPPPPQEAPIPDMTVDPAGHLAGQFSRLQRERDALNERLAKLESGSSQLAQTQAAQQAAGELQAWGLAQEQAFAAEHPDYPHAIGHLRQAREQMLRAMGWTAPDQVAAALSQDVRQLATIARKQGVNFGQMLYDLASAHGYRSNGQAGAAAAAARPQADSAAERLVRGAEMAQGIGQTAGAPRGEPAAQSIAAMSDHEFEQLYVKLAKQGPGALRGVFGS